MRSNDVSARPVGQATGDVYVGLDAARKQRHLSLIPLVAGLESCCGEVLTQSRPVRWQLAFAEITCASCLAEAKHLISRRRPR